jgi:DNA-binding HxlR family transcriptional regulator
MKAPQEGTFMSPSNIAHTAEAAPAADGTPMSGATPATPQRLDHKSENCIAAREVLNRVGDKWSVLLVSLLGDGPKRFTELKRNTEGISQRMLTLTLRGLERDGLVTRKIFPTIPPRVEYSLTPLGKTLLVPVKALGEWAQDHRLAIQDARRSYDANAAREHDGSESSGSDEGDAQSAETPTAVPTVDRRRA